MQGLWLRAVLLSVLWLVPGSIMGQSVSFEEVTSGGSTGVASVSTSTAISLANDDLYVAAVTSKPFRSVVDVSGLGLAWVRVDGLCSGRSQTGVDVWVAQGSPVAAGAVTATLASGAESAAIAVSRYSGVDLTDAIGPSASANTNGPSGACSGGSDSRTYAFDLRTTTPGSAIFVAVAHRNRSHTPGPGWIERIERMQGAGGSVASVSTADAVASSPSTISVNGNLSGDTDWAAVAFELLPFGSSVSAPAIAVTPTAHDFGPAVVGDIVPHSFEVRNDGTLSLEVSGSTITGADADEFSIVTGAAPFSLEPGTATSLVVRFEPSRVGPAQAILELVSNDPDDPSVPIAVSGVGSALVPDIRVVPSSHDFGDVSIGDSRSTRFTVLNDGALQLVVESASLSGLGAADYSVDTGMPLTVMPGATRDITVSFHAATLGTADATLTITSDDPDEGSVPVGLTANAVALPGSGEMWISRAVLRSLAMSGSAWNAVKSAADGALGTPDLSGFTNNHDVKTLAVALVWARTGVFSYRQKARDAIMSAIGTEIGTTQAVQPARNTVSYVLAADLIQLSELDPEADATLREWLDQLRYVVWPDGSIVEEDYDRANNHGRMAGATRAAIAVYLGDQAELDAAAAVFHGFLGNRDAYNDFRWTGDLSWQADQNNPVGINPVGSTIDGFPVDGALPEEMRRGCSFRVPPCQTGYPWEGMQGAFTEAVILSRAGYDVFNWEDRALLRSMRYVEELQNRYPGTQWWATGDDTWLPWLINKIYGTSFPTEPARTGKCMGWTDWTHAP